MTARSKADSKRASKKALVAIPSSSPSADSSSFPHCKRKIQRKRKRKKKAKPDFLDALLKSAWHRLPNPVKWPSMGHNKGKDNVKARAARRKKNERLKAAKGAEKAPAK